MSGTENEKLPDTFYREQFIKLGLFSAITVVLAGLLVFFTLISRNSWRNGLRDKINSVLEENSVSIRAGEWVKLSSSLNFQVSAYKAESDRDEGMYAVILRTQSLYGPLASVYTFDSKKDRVVFAGYADIPPKIKDTLTDIAGKNQNDYWEKKIPSIIKGAEVNE